VTVGDYGVLRRATSSGKNNTWKRNLQIAEKGSQLREPVAV